LTFTDCPLTSDDYRLTCGVITLVLGLATVAGAQDQADPRVAMPERPTVATHAFTVAPRYAELETGIEWDHNEDGSYGISTPSALKIGLNPRGQFDVASTFTGGTGNTLGLGDTALTLKYRVGDRVPLLGAFAVQPGIKFPTGRSAHGSDTTDASIIFISSHHFGDVALDINIGYTRQLDGPASGLTDLARNTTVWTVSTGGTISGSLGFAAEVFGYPATAGERGTPGSAAILVGPTVTIRPWAVFDVGGIIRVRGDQPNALYSGLVYNFGKL
jgi:hypothetical protein